MGFVTSSDGSFLRTFDGNYIASSDTVFLTLTGPTASGVIGTAYSSSVTATGATPANVWSIANGALPTSLTLNATTGAITGTPTVAGLFTTDVLLIDSIGSTQIISFTILITSVAVVGSGVYKLIPSQTYDELYTTVPATQNVKIPNPYIETGLIGDED